MPLTVEDGTGVANADAWADQAAFATWQVDFEGIASTATTALQEAAIRRAVAYLTALPWLGSKTNGRGQALAWPRTGATDGEGEAIASDEIPVEVIRVQHMLASTELTKPGTLNPQVNMAGRKVLTKAGDIQWTFVGGETGSTDAHRTLILGAIDLIAGFLAKDITDVKDRDDVFIGIAG